MNAERRMLAGAVAVTLWACAPSESGTADSAAMAAPQALTVDMVVGTWNGVSMAEGSDSVVNRWTSIRTAEGAKLVTSTSPDTIRSTAVFDGDSVVSTSEPYAGDTTAAAPKLMYRSVMRLVDGKLVGRTTIMLADKPDSVVTRTRFEATRAP